MTMSGRCSWSKMVIHTRTRADSDRSRVKGGKRWYMTVARSLKHGPSWWMLATGSCWSLRQDVVDAEDSGDNGVGG